MEGKGREEEINQTEERQEAKTETKIINYADSEPPAAANEHDGNELTVSTSDGIPEGNVLVNLLKYVISLIENRISYDETKEKMFQALYLELQEYKDGFIESIQKPIIKTFLPIYDIVLRLEKIVQENKQGREYLQNEICILKSEIEEAFYRLDVIPFSEHPEILDRKLHKTVGIVETCEPNEDKKITKILRRGLFWKDKILRPEEVIIKKYNSQKEEKNV